MDKGNALRDEHRSSALWRTEDRDGDSRSGPLWGKGGRGLVTALVALLVVGAPFAAGAPKRGTTQRQPVVASTTPVDAAELVRVDRPQAGP